MSELKFGDRVKVILSGIDEKTLLGEMGTVIDIGADFLSETDLIGVEFDNNVHGHDCCGYGKNGHCWWCDRKYLKKVEDIEEETAEDTEEEPKEKVETKAEALEQKILTVLREEIGVEIGEEFEVYQNGERQWTCRFDKNGFARITDKGNSVSFDESWVWKYIVSNFHKYKFKRKPFAPECGEDYFFLGIEYDEINSITFRALQSTWIGSSIDYGMLAVGNIFRTEEEALKRKDKLLEKLEKLRKAK